MPANAIMIFFSCAECTDTTYWVERFCLFYDFPLYIKLHIIIFQGVCACNEGGLVCLGVV